MYLSNGAVTFPAVGPHEQAHDITPCIIPFTCSIFLLRMLALAGTHVKQQVMFVTWSVLLMSTGIATW